jgi:hypothetical protein
MHLEHYVVSLVSSSGHFERSKCRETFTHWKRNITPQKTWAISGNAVRPSHLALWNILMVFVLLEDAVSCQDDAASVTDKWMRVCVEQWWNDWYWNNGGIIDTGTMVEWLILEQWWNDWYWNNGGIIDTGTMVELLILEQWWNDWYCNNGGMIDTGTMVELLVLEQWWNDWYWNNGGMILEEGKRSTWRNLRPIAT